jgi:hypothetical protein
MSTIVTRIGKGAPLTNEEGDANIVNLNNDKYQSGDNINAADLSLTGFYDRSTELSIVAGPTQTQAGATLLTKENNVVSTVAVDNDGVRLPSATVGRSVYIRNSDAVNFLKVYPFSGDDIDTGGVNVADVNTLTAGSQRIYLCEDGTNWTSLSIGSTSPSGSTGDPQLVGVNTQAVSGDFLVATAGSIVITLPITPSAGDFVIVKDGTGAAATTSFTVARNGSNIAASATDLIFDTNYEKLTMVYIDGTIGWSV